MIDIKNTNNNNKEASSAEEEEFEILFWKVIHNKYIFCKIFHFIETVEWVEYPNYFRISDYNFRIKFKDIHSLEWMIVNKQYQLLKYKLQHCEKLIKSNSTNAHTVDNYIEITESGMDTLLKLGTFALGNEKKQQELEDEALALSELLPLILENKKLEITNINLIKISMANNNILALQILLNEPYSYQMYPSHLEWSIQNSKVPLVSYIISLPNVTIHASTRSKSIKLAFENIRYRDEMLQFILDNPQLYNSQTSSTTTSQVDLNDNNNETRKKFKSEDGTPINIEATNEKLQFLSLFQIDSLEIQNKLLDLHCFEQIEQDSLHIGNSSKFDRVSHSINRVLKFANVNKVGNGSGGNGNSGNGDRVKEIHKLLAIELKEYYDSYLSHYDEPINGLDLMVLIEHCISTYSIKSLSYLLSNEYCIGYLYSCKHEIEDIYTSYIPSNTFTPTIEFIKLYLSNISKFNNKQCTGAIDNYILNIGSSKEYELILNEISKGTKNINRYPSKWNSVLSRTKDSVITKEMVDYLVGFRSNYYVQNKIEAFQLSQKFESCQVLEYAMQSIEHSSLTIGDLYKCAIQTCNIEVLNLFKDTFNDQISTIFLMPAEIKSIASQPIENLIKLFNYFKATNYQGFTEIPFMELIDSLCSNIGGGNSNFNDEINQLLSLLPYNKFKKASISLLVNSMYSCDPIKIKFILNNFNPISTPEFIQTYNDVVQFSYVLYSRNCWISVLYQSAKFLESIEIILGHLNQEISSSGTTSTINIEMYSAIVNCFFKHLISTTDIKLVNIYNIFNLIKTTNDNIVKFNTNQLQQQQQIITIEQSLYNSFFYICLKSIKFQKYLMELPYITSVFEEEDDGDVEYCVDIDYETDGYDIAKYLDPSVFTFEYLFGNGSGNGSGNEGGASFDQVLEKLVYHLSILPATKNNLLIDAEREYYYLALKSDLAYFLSINRKDLVFKLLDEIQQQLNDTSFVIGSFPTVIQNVVKDPIFINGIGGNDEIELYQQTITNGRIFKFSPSIFNVCCKVFKESEFEFQKFISFCSYYSIIDSLANINGIYVNSHYLNHFNQYQAIIKTRYQGDDYQLLKDECFKEQIISIQYGLGYGHSYCGTVGLKIDHLIKYEKYFISAGDKILIGIDKLNEKLGYNGLLGKKQFQFNLVLRELLSKHFSYTDLPNYFVVTETMIDIAIFSGFVGILKYYYQNKIGGIEILQYLKDRLLLHYDYKYSNWLK